MNYLQKKSICCLNAAHKCMRLFEHAEVRACVLPWQQVWRQLLLSPLKRNWTDAALNTLHGIPSCVRDTYNYATRNKDQPLLPVMYDYCQDPAPTTSHNNSVVQRLVWISARPFSSPINIRQDQGVTALMIVNLPHMLALFTLTHLFFSCWSGKWASVASIQAVKNL